MVCTNRSSNRAVCSTLLVGLIVLAVVGWTGAAGASPAVALPGDAVASSPCPEVMELALLADVPVTITGTVPLTGAPITLTADVPVTGPVTLTAVVSLVASGSNGLVTITLSTGQPAGQAPSSAPAAASGVTAEMCQGCHPHDKIFEATADYTTFEGYEINPHVTVDPIEESQTMANPHASGQNVVDCLNCHQPHSLPMPAEGEVKEPPIDYCYSCHHTTSFQKCSACH